MKIVPLADVKARLSAYIKQCQTDGPVVITRNGQAVAALLVPMDEDDLERLILAHSPRFQALLNKSYESIKAGKGLSSDEFWKAVKQRRSRLKKAKSTSN
jgi:prevent-host-death family protein